MVSEACRAAGVGRTTVYERRQADEDFALAWADVEERSTELLEQIAVRRAAQGSDVLLIFLLKSRRPDRYRENVKVEHGGQVRHGVEILGGKDPVAVPPEVRDQIAQLLSGGG